MPDQDQKLSQLTGATQPLAGTELVYAVQGGAERRTTAAAIAALAAATNLSYDPATMLLSSSTGADVTLPLAATTDAGLQSAADKAKLDSITVDQARIVRWYVRNETGVTIAKGIPVYASGTNGVTPTISPADASTEETAARTIGITQEAIAHQAYGWVVEVGPLDGITTSTLTENAIIWLSETTGQMTTTRPTQPAHGVALGYCVKQGAGTSGIIYVKVDNGLELAELHDVLLTGATPGVSVLGLDVDGLWKPKTISSGSGSGFAGYQTGRWITPVPGNFSLGTGLTANAIQALPFEVKRQIRVGGMGGRVATIAAGSNVQFAVYDSTSAGIINNPIRSTASLGGGTAQFISDTAIASFLLLPGNLYWWAVASDAGPVMQAVVNTNTNFTCLAGADSASASSSATASITAYSFAGTFGTWPNLSAASPTAVTNNRNAYPFLLISAFV